MNLEIRNDSIYRSGYANVTSRESRVLSSPQGKFIEIVEPNTFAKAIERNKAIKLLLNHDKNSILGSSNNNVEMREDNIGLWVEATITNEDIIQKARNGELTAYSFGFICNECRFVEHEDGIQRRYLRDIDLNEVSLLTKDRTPAYFATRVCEVRDNEEKLIEERADNEFNIIDKTEKLNDENIESKGEDYSSFFYAKNFIKIHKY